MFVFTRAYNYQFICETLRKFIDGTLVFSNGFMVVNVENEIS